MTDTADTILLDGYFRDRSIDSIAQDLRSGRITSAALVEHSLAAIERLNPVLNAFNAINAEAAMAAARNADHELARGQDRTPLHGIPVSIKDIVDVAGYRTTSGSAVYLERRAAADAECVRRLRSAGAVIVGKNVLHEFAYGATGDRSIHGASRNPWNPNRISGGSSGGSAVAVAAGMVPLAVGTDTAGSVRVPAALCGIVGFKPAYDAIPTVGVHNLAPSLDHVGVLARTAADAALGYSVMAASESVMAASEQHGHRATTGRVAWVDPTRIAPTDQSVTTAVRAALDSAGVTISGIVELNSAVGELFSVFSTLQSAEAYCEHIDDFASHRARIDREVVDRLERGRDTPASRFVRATRQRDRLRSLTAEMLGQYDVLAMPTVPTVATDIGQREHTIEGHRVEVRSALLALTAPWNLTGYPAISVPAGVVAGLPVGLQLISLPGRELLLFQLADLVERARP